MQIGKKIYYDKLTGAVIQNTGERDGEVGETTTEQDFQTYTSLAERVPETVGVLQFAYGELAQDFQECIGYKVDVSGANPVLLFSYPDATAPTDPPVYRKSLSVELDEAKAKNVNLESRLGDIEMYLADLIIV